MANSGGVVVRAAFQDALHFGCFGEGVLADCGAEFGDDLHLLGFLVPVWRLSLPHEHRTAPKGHASGDVPILIPRIPYFFFPIYFALR